jgi:hypothetical protein
VLVMLLWCAVAAVAAPATEATVRKLLSSGRDRLVLPAGVIDIRRELIVPPGAEVAGHPRGTVLRAAGRFRGRAVLVCRGSGISISRITIDGNRAALARPIEIAPYDQPFAVFYASNGIVAVGATRLRIRDVTLRGIANFAILVSASHDVAIDRVTVLGSGSLNARGRNNTSGGILIEEGTTQFAVRDSVFRGVRGNGVWTHSLYTSSRNARGEIAGNRFEEIGRDAIQVGHATEVRVERNTGLRIGYPVAIVDVEGGGTPVAIDTAGNVDRSIYAGNRFDEVNGKCIDLDGFHHGEVRENVCRNATPEDDMFGHYGIVMNNTNPDMQSRNIQVTGNTMDGTKYGGIFVIGRGHFVTGNRFLRGNSARCETPTGACLFDPEQPNLLLAGIYLGRKAERPDPAVDNTITGNVVTGHGMRDRCIAAAPGIDLRSQTIERNECRSTKASKP